MFESKTTACMPASRRDFLRKLLASPVAAIPNSNLFSTFAFFRDDNLKSRLAADPLRPQFHLLPAKNWMNDPNGPIFWKGLYHMFYQYNPNEAVWGDMHWAHAISPDMIHWRHLPIALAPTPGWADADGCFTGSAVDDHGTATFIYTGVKSVTPEMATLRDGAHNFREVQCLATSRDPQLRTWTKWKTPIIEPPADPLLAGFRDPFLWRDADLWYLGVGSGVRKQGGSVLLYRSKDLRQWEYLHPLASGKWTERENINPVDSGEMWECPDFFSLGSKHVLLYSTAGKVMWETGELDPKELAFHSQRTGVLDHGAYYAQKTQLDAQGNRILWGWIPEKRPDSELIAAGWAGCMALPRVLYLGSSGELLMRVDSAAEALRTKAFARSDKRGSSFEILTSTNDIRVEGLCGEIYWITPSERCAFTLEDAGGVWLSIKLAPRDSSFATLTVNGKSVEVPFAAQRIFEFHLFVDGSVTELICNRRDAFTTRVYRQSNGPLRFRSSEAFEASFKVLQAWQLRPISTNRLTT